MVSPAHFAEIFGRPFPRVRDKRQNTVDIFFPHVSGVLADLGPKCSPGQLGCQTPKLIIRYQFQPYFSDNLSDTPSSRLPAGECYTTTA